MILKRTVLKWKALKLSEMAPTGLVQMSQGQKIQEWMVPELMKMGLGDQELKILAQTEQALKVMEWIVVALESSLMMLEWKVLELRGWELKMLV